MLLCEGNRKRMHFVINNGKEMIEIYMGILTPKSNTTRHGK